MEKMQYRPLTYWGWLERITPEEVQRQIEEMYRAGLGGYVMHARGGLEIPYMGEEWRVSVAAMIDKGKKLGMTTVVDDEDGWPSGFGAGEVNGMGEAYWLKWLQFEKIKAGNFRKTPQTIGTYLYKANGMYTRCLDKTRDSDTDILHIYYKSNPYYVDNLDPAVVRAFIRSSYEVYHVDFEREFGDGIQSIFSDEPQLARQYIPWSFTIPAVFENNYSYDLLDSLPALFFPSGDYQKVRYHFWSTINKLFTDSYAGQIGEWCSNHGIALSGHVVNEENLGLQVLGSGGAMPFYEYMQIPGVDWLQRIGVSNTLVKQAASVGYQLGKKRVLSEMFGCAGWNVSFAELKWIGEWHFVLGVNLMLQHLGLYSLKGSRKREYPASLFFQQPWWDEYRVFNDYFAGLSQIMCESKPDVNLLVLHPLKSAWIAFEGQDAEKIGWENPWDIESHIMNPESEYFKDIKDLDKSFKLLTDMLLALNFDFHYGDETIMARHCGVEGNKIRVGQCVYSAVIIPPSITLDRNTMKHLLEFAENGGKLFSVGHFPELVEGRYSDELFTLRRYAVFVPNERDALSQVLTAAISRPLYVTVRNGINNSRIYCCTRIASDKRFYYIVNTDMHCSYEVDIHISHPGVLVVRLDPVSGLCEPFDASAHACLEPGESMLLFRDMNEIKPSISRDVITYQTVARTALPTDEPWEIKSHDLNSITLDTCQYSIDGGEWQPELPVIKLQQKIVALGRPADINMMFRFYAEDLIEGSLYLVMEEPDRFDIRLNGAIINSAYSGWWVDPSFRKLDITGRVIKGWNEIRLSIHFYCSEKVYKILAAERVHEAEMNRLRYDIELESVYLLGDFKVMTRGEPQFIDRRALITESSFRLAPMDGQTKLNELVTEGFPFFAGRIALSKKITPPKLADGLRAILSLEKPDAIICKVSVNGKQIKTLAWAPYTADITDALTDGENELSIELISSLRNLLGPHHHADGELYAVIPSSFQDELKWTDRYCFTRFGIEKGEITYEKPGQVYKHAPL